jgi:hypothetical protein
VKFEGRTAAAGVLSPARAKKFSPKQLFLHPFNTPPPLPTLKNIAQDERLCYEALPHQQLASEWIKYRQQKDLFA